MVSNMFSQLFKYNLIMTSKIHNARNGANTIFALSSGFGKCGVAVIRISGPDSKEVLRKMAGFTQPPEPRRVSLRKIRNPQNQNVLDQSLVVWFPGPKSFTGEDCCELQVHGGKAVISSILRALSEMNNLRPAAPGEFTKRAFYAGKLDLTEVEGLADLIEAETEAQRKQALNQMDGALSRIYNSWRESLIQNMAQIEAYIDFSESENIEDNLIENTKSSIEELLHSVKKHMLDGRRGERLRDGVQTVILGAPNVGKSSLLNLLCRKEEAIVSSISGTTRDIVTSTLDIGGYPLVIKDTAGLRRRTISEHSGHGDITTDPVEIEGITRALNAAQSADLILLVMDPSHINPHKPLTQSLVDYCQRLGISDLVSNCDNSFFKIQTSVGRSQTKNCLLLLNKVDLMQVKDEMDIFDCAISCQEEEGIEKLLEILTLTLQKLCGTGDMIDATCNQMRHNHCLSEVVTSLESSLSCSEADIVAHHIRQALQALGKITGHVSTEQILDVIFKNFCVGK